MFLIICHHLVIRSAQTCGYTHPFNINEDVLGGGIGLIINSLSICGVNLFLLIQWLVWCKKNMVTNSSTYC